MSCFRCRAAVPSDYPAILTLNQQSERFLSPLDLGKLVQLAKEAAVFQVTLSGDTLAAFLLTFSPEANYDSPNFLWFKNRYPDFLYIDRIVIAESFRGQHLASNFYAQLKSHAITSHISRLACEVDIDPPNPVSLRFHQKQGFIEVGQQSIRRQGKDDRQKIVSLQVKPLIWE